MDVLRSARKSGIERTKNEHIKETMRVKGNPDITDIVEKKRLQRYGHVKRMPENTKMNNGMDTRGENKNRTSK
jgi:hypothetical protein